MWHSVLLILTLSFLLSACAAFSQRRDGDSDPAFLKGQSAPKTHDEIAENLTRTDTVRYYPYALTVKATLTTAPLLIASAEKSVLDSAFKEKWSDEKAAAELAERKKKILALRPGLVCFNMNIETRDGRANDTKAWHGVIRVGDKQISDVTFTPMDGFVKTTTTTSTSQYGTTSVYDTKDYYMYSVACADKPFDSSQPFVFVVQPRYAREVGEFELAWGMKLPPKANKLP